VRSNASALFSNFMAKEGRPPDIDEQRSMIGKLQATMITELNIFGNPKTVAPVGVLPPVPVVTKPATPPPAKTGPKVGDTATNKATGARVRWDGKNWVPL
jgi:hypothetical protein